MKDDDHPPAPPYQPRHHRHRLLVGHVFNYTWPSGEVSLVVVASEPDEDGTVSVALLPLMKERVLVTRLDRLA